MIDWEWYDDINTKVLFLHCLFKANHKDKKYRGTVVKRGTFLTGRELLAQETGLSVRQIRTSLSKLKSTNELAIKSSSKGSVVEVVNYSKHQERIGQHICWRMLEQRHIMTDSPQKDFMVGQ